MDDRYLEIFPAKLSWPKAVADVAHVDAAAETLRLVSKVKGIEKLPQLSRLKKLWCFDVNQRFLEIICRCGSLEELYLDGLSFLGIGELHRLKSLRILFLERGTKIDDLADLSDFKHLKGLGIQSFKKVHDLAPLSGLVGLESLVIAGGMERSSRMDVASFHPLSNLRNLRFLHLTNIKALDGSLKPLETLDQLRQLDIANFYSMEEFARLAGALRHTHCTWFSPYFEVKFKACPKCGSLNGAMLPGKGVAVLCRTCDAKRLTKHVERFERIRDRA